MSGIGGNALLTVSAANGANARLLPVSDVSAAWAVSEVGTLSAFIPSRTAYRQGYDEWKGLRVLYQHSHAGPWAGTIVDDPVTLDDGTLELSAQDVGRIGLHGRRTPYLFPIQMGAAGTLVRRAFSLAAQETPQWITDIHCDEDGRLFEVEFRADDLLSFVRRMADDSGQEWETGVNDDGSLYFRWRKRIGRDRDILLVEGYQIAGGSVTRSIETVVNDLQGIADDRDYARAATNVVRSPSSIDRFGTIQGSTRFPGVVNVSTVEPQTRAAVAMSAEPVIAPTITIPDTHPIVAEIRNGDGFRLVVGSANAEYQMRAMRRHVAGGVMEITGDAAEVEA